LESVAETGYRVLAAQMASDTLGHVLQEPILLGAGHKSTRTKAAQPVGMSVTASRSVVNNSVRFLNCELQTGSQMEIYSTGPATTFLFNPPLTKSQAVSEAVKDTEWSLDGLQNCRNSVVQVGACVTAIPVGLWKQTVACTQGLTRSKLESARTALSAAVMQSRPREAIAAEIARNLSAKGSLNVALVSAPTTSRARGLSAPRSAAVQTAFASLKTGGGLAPFSALAVGDTVLEITVSYAGFGAADGINPRLPLTVGAQATLFSKSDGQCLYSCPIQYRSVERTFASWAADDARLFRQEADSCYSQIADAVVKELIGRGIVAPVRGPAALLVTR
jgi:hypothetical protein